MTLSSEESLIDYIENNLKILSNIVDPWLHSLSKIKYLLYIGSKYNLKFVSLKQNPIDLIWVSNREMRQSRNKKAYNKICWNKYFRKNSKFPAPSTKTSWFTYPTILITWLLNIRGADLKHTPIILTRAIIFRNKKLFLFI